MKKKISLLVFLLKNLRDRSCFCSEAHIQKIVYLASKLFDVPFGYTFTLHKNRVHSFQLTDEISDLCVDGIIESCPDPIYGSSFTTGKIVFAKDNSVNDETEEDENKISFLTTWLAKKKVVELESISLVAFISEKKSLKLNEKNEAILKEVNTFFPSYSQEKIFASIQELNRIIENFEKSVQNSHSHFGSPLKDYDNKNFALNVPL